MSYTHPCLQSLASVFKQLGRPIGVFARHHAQRSVVLLLSVGIASVSTLALMSDHAISASSELALEPVSDATPAQETKTAKKSERGFFSRLFGRDDAESDNKMSLEEAREKIASQQALDTIPKSVWKQLLSKEQYDILWEADTERPFTGQWLDEKRPGVFVTAGCRLPVFSQDHKFKSGTGWPSFWEVVNRDNVVLKTDYSWGMKRIEVLSACGEHLGHVFDDGPKPTGLRYCINSLALDFVPVEDSAPSATGL